MSINKQLLATSQKNQNVTLWKIAVDIHNLKRFKGVRMLTSQQG